MRVKFFYTTITGWDGREAKYAVGYQPIDKDKMMVSFARCSANDRFVKDKARKMCMGRLEVGKCEVVEKQPDQDKYVALREAIAKHEQKVASAYAQH